MSVDFPDPGFPWIQKIGLSKESSAQVVKGTTSGLKSQWKVFACESDTFLIRMPVFPLSRLAKHSNELLNGFLKDFVGFYTIVI
jgi:hypothetical protein